MNFLKLDLFPQLHGHLLKSLAVMTLAMARSSHCHSTRVAQAATETATVASARRRWERLLDNQHLDPQAMFQKFCQFLSGVWAGRRGQTKISSDGSERSLDELAPRHGSPMRCIRGEVFKTDGWLDARITAVWERRCKEPWLLISDSSDGYRCCRTYCKRMWCEESFRDEKSHGFHWDQSNVDVPAHAGRLLLLMALATLLCIALGAALVRRGLRRILDCHRQRM